MTKVIQHPQVTWLMWALGIAMYNGEVLLKKVALTYVCIYTNVFQFSKCCVD